MMSGTELFPGSKYYFSQYQRQRGREREEKDNELITERVQWILGGEVLPPHSGISQKPLAGEVKVRQRSTQASSRGENTHAEDKIVPRFFKTQSLHCHIQQL